MTHVRFQHFPRSLPLALLLASAAAAPAMAADPAPLRGSMSGGGGYVALRGGMTFGDDTAFGVGGVTGVAAVETDYDGGGFVAGAVGLRRGALRGEVELSYSRFGVDTHRAIVPPTTAGGTATRVIFNENESFGEASAISLMASAYVDGNFGRFSPFAGVGVGIGRLKAEEFGVQPLAATLPGGVVLDADGYGLAYHATVGTAFQVSDKVGLELAYRYQGIEAQLDGLGGIETDVELTSHNVIAGVRIGF